MSDVAATMAGGQGGVRIRVKVVPNASRSRVAGVLGDHLKISVAAPPEAGKANAAVRALLAETLGVAERGVEIVSGHTQPRKVVFVSGVTLCEAHERVVKAME